MIEILWHGRGGQGAFTAARLLGAAGSLAEGRYGLAFPSFGPERRGAPMCAFTKLDDKPIGDRSAITRADFVVYLDSTLFGEGWESELKEGGRVLLNSPVAHDDPRVISLDASGISREVLGRDIPNTALLGALACLSDALTMEDAREAVRQYMAPKLQEKNFRVLDAVEGALAGDAGAAAADAAAEAGGPGAGAGAGAGADESEGLAAAVRPDCQIPTLRENPQLDPEEFAKNTCWEAGYLVSKNAGWRTVRPVIDAAACKMCLQCYLQCPDGTVFRTADGVAIDYDFCKGCGMCAVACKFGAIAMVPEQGR